MLWPFFLYGFFVLTIVAGILVLSYLLGPRRQRRLAKPYESGVDPTGTARLRISVKYYLVAMFFVIFDLEAVFIFAWAVALREAGWAGFVEMLIFIGVLVAALAYLLREGALDWAPERRKKD
jgi:NADH-quinone oxidoreductase subunit A